MSAAQNNFDIGYKAVENMVKCLQGEEYGDVDTGTEIVTAGHRAGPSSTASLSGWRNVQLPDLTISKSSFFDHLLCRRLRPPALQKMEPGCFELLLLQVQPRIPIRLIKPRTPLRSSKQAALQRLFSRESWML